MLSRFSDTLEGLVTIRRSKKENKFLYRFGFQSNVTKTISLINIFWFMY